MEELQLYQGSCKRRKAFSTCFILALMSLLVQAQDPQVLQLGDIQRGISIKEDSTAYFSVLIDKKRYPEGSKMDLVIKAFSEGNDRSETDVYISKKNQKPNRPAAAEWTCAGKGDDTCTVNSRDISPGDTFYIGVRCYGTQTGGDKCRISLEASLEGELVLEDTVEQMLDFKAYETKLFRFKIPPQSTSFDESQRVKSVVINVVPFLPTGEKINLQASTKGQINPKRESKRGVAGWRKGVTLRLSEDDDKSDEWCTDCYVTIMVDVENAGKYQIMAQTNVALQQLEEGVKLDDVSFYGDRQCYKYYVKDAKTDVNVRVAIFSGLLSYTFTPKTIPERYDDAQFKNAETGSSAIVITPSDRTKQPVGLYYMCIFAHMTSTYSVQVFETPVNQTFRYLEDGWDETGEIQGRNVSVYVYKVPPLEYATEDIKVEFQLLPLSGETPKMYAKFCKYSDPKKCGQNVTRLDVEGLKQGYLPARAVGKGLAVVFDHNEDLCQSELNGECYYIIALLGAGRTDGDLSRYSLISWHEQLNHQVLIEGQATQSYVETGGSHYYSFTIPPSPPSTKKQQNDTTRVRNVSIILNSMHGDADLYVSRTNRFPQKNSAEKSSIKAGDMLDIVYFDDKTGTTDLSGTYYIQVTSFQYSTFTIQVNVDRGAIGADSKSLLSAKTIQTLIEGIPIRGVIDSVDGEDYYLLNIKQIAGYERPIKIQVSPLQGTFRVSASVGVKPTPKNFTWRSSSNSLIIDPKTDKNFVREGMYYIAVKPKPNFYESLFGSSNKYQYLISYLTEDSFLYLSNQYPLELEQKANTTTYIRHFISKDYKDLSLSLTVTSGNPSLYVSFSPSQKWPNSSTPNTFSSKNQLHMQQASKGTALFFPHQVFQVQNPACKDPSLESSEPCVLFGSVLCEGGSDCKYSLKLSYEEDGMQQVFIGQPIHRVVKDNQYQNYYITVKQSSIKEGQNMIAVLTSMKGNADLFVKFQETPQSMNPNEWDPPNEVEYVYKSTQSADKQDIVKIDLGRDPNLLDCFQKFSNRYGTEPECAILFSIFSPLTQEGRDAMRTQDGSDVSLGEKFTSRYNFVVYVDIMQLLDKVPVSASVEQGTFQYFIFESSCDDCTILVSLSTRGSGDPDLYINFGDERLPSREDSDMQSSTLKSEVITINLQHQFFKKNNLKSMRGPYLIGIYGQKKSNFTLVISQEKYPLGLLLDNTALKATQEAFEIVYYAWYNVDTGKTKERDFRLTLNVKTGAADVYMSKYVDEEGQGGNTNNENIVGKLPKSKKDALWLLENIDSKTAQISRELVVVNQERNYCVRCFYLIGVVTHEFKTDYSIQLDALDQADYSNSHIMKIGENYQTTLNAEKGDSFRLYRFILDDVSPLQIVQSSEGGHIETVLSFHEDGSQPIATITNSQVWSLGEKDSNFQVDRMYYLRVNELGGAPRALHQLMIMQQATVVKLADGVPMKLNFIGENDINKHIIFSIPDGEYTFSFQVKSMLPSFHPLLYVKYYPDLQSVLSGLEFPPGGESGYFIGQNWDYKLGIMTYQEKFSGIKTGSAGLAMNLKDPNPERRQGENAEVYITVSASPIIKIITGTTYIGTLDHTDSFRIYQVEETDLAKAGFLMVEFTPCIGDTEFKFIEDPQQPNKYIDLSETANYKQLIQEKHGKIYHFVPLPRKKLYIVVKQQKLGGTTSNKDFEADFLLKVRVNQRAGVKNTEFFLPEDGRLSYSLIDDNQGINLNWGDIHWTNNVGGLTKQGRNKVTYTVVATKDNRARLDTQCVLRKEVASKFVLANFDDQEGTSFSLRAKVEGQRYYMNVIAKVHADDEKESELIPYQPIEIYIPEAQITFSKIAILFFVVFVLFFGAAALYYYQQTKMQHRRLPNDNTYSAHHNSGSSTSGSSGGRAIEMSTFQRPPKQSIRKVEEKQESVGEYQPVSIFNTTMGDGVQDNN